MNESTNVKHLALAGLFLAVGMIMPSIFHLAGPQGGKIFLPLFWGVTLSALILPKNYTLLVALILPILSHFTTGMPPVPMVYFMVIELIVYGFAASALVKKIPPIFAIGGAFLISRCVYSLAVMAAALLFHLPAPFSGVAALFGGILLSLPGIIMQMVLAPVLCKIYFRVRNQGAI